MRKEITSQFRLSEFKSTPCYRQLVEFIQSLAEAVAGKALTDECLVSPAVQCVLDDLQQMSEWVAEIPPTLRSEGERQLAKAEHTTVALEARRSILYPCAK